MKLKLLPLVLFVATATGCAPNQPKPKPVEEDAVIVTKAAYLQPSFTVKDKPVEPVMQKDFRDKNWKINAGDNLFTVFNEWAVQEGWQITWEGDYLKAQAKLELHNKSLPEAIETIIAATRSQKAVDVYEGEGNNLILIRDGGH